VELADLRSLLSQLDGKVDHEKIANYVRTYIFVEKPEVKGDTLEINVHDNVKGTAHFGA
jgi:hypothetical protein